MKKSYKSDLLNYIVATSMSPRERARKEAYQKAKMKRNYANYKVDCLFMKKQPMTFTEFKETYKNKPYQEENLF